MIRIIFIIMCGLTSFVAAGRSVTDHLGRVVNVPDTPQRIVSLHDWTLTVMAHELGAHLVGSTGRLGPDGHYFIRGGRELFGLDFSAVALASVHGKPDLERISMLKPDLILANSGDYASLVSQLSTIAPTLMFNPEQGRPMLSLYQELAGWLGRESQFDALKQHYHERVAELRQRLKVTGTPAATYVAILVNGRDGTIDVLKDYGALTTVMDDLGYRPMPIVASVPAGANRMIMAAELIESIDADYIVTSYLPEKGETADSVYQDLDRIAPGARGFLHAFTQRQAISISRYEVYPPSFKGLELTLERLSATIQQPGQL